ncbi:MAG: thymidine kinase [Bdellovibrionota bacterium]
MNFAPQSGWIEVICGSMFSGKTEELIRRIRRALIAQQKTVLFKPSIDHRYNQNKIVSHDDNHVEAIPVSDPKDILERSKHFDVIGIDEIQFFSDEIVDICEQLAQSGKRVIASGLDQDYKGRPFGPMPKLLCISEFITKNLAICMVCGGPANKSQRLIPAENQVLIGGHERYEARCRTCYSPDTLPSSTSKEEREISTQPVAP